MDDSHLLGWKRGLKGCHGVYRGLLVLQGPWGYCQLAYLEVTRAQGVLQGPAGVTQGGTKRLMLCCFRAVNNECLFVR